MRGEGLPYLEILEWDPPSFPAFVAPVSPKDHQHLQYQSEGDLANSVASVRPSSNNLAPSNRKKKGQPVKYRRHVSEQIERNHLPQNPNLPSHHQIAHGRVAPDHTPHLCGSPGKHLLTVVTGYTHLLTSP